MRKTAFGPLLVTLLVAGGLTLLDAQQAAPPRRIAVFGSSVANGTGDDLGQEGYTGRLRALLAPRGWEVLNQSRGGDNTKTMAPRFAPEGSPDPKVRYLRAGGRGALEFEATTLTSTTPFGVTLGVRNGVWIYTASNGTRVVSGVKADAAAHHLVVSHYTARGETLFFVDGTLAGRVFERLEPRQFNLGGAGVVDFKDRLIYRSALNADEVAALESGRLLRASLEVYSPLTDLDARSGGTATNLAQSLSWAQVGARTVTHIDR